MIKVAVVVLLSLLFGIIQPAFAADNAVVDCGGITVIIILGGAAVFATGGLALIPIAGYFLLNGCSSD